LFLSFILLAAADSQDYFYNFFDLGIDILFDGEAHRVKRIILRTNIPGHMDFNSYRKCNFRVFTPREVVAVAQSNGHEVQPPSAGKKKKKEKEREREKEQTNGSPSLLDLEDTAVFTCDSSWSAVQEALGKPSGDPVIANRGSVPNPYGATRFYGYPNLIAEVVDTNLLASLTIFPE